MSYMNRAFVCHPKSNCSVQKDGNIKEYCEKAYIDTFICLKSKEIIYFYQVCNHVYDCLDGSDEELCCKHLKKLN